MRSDRLIALLLAGILGGANSLAWAQAITLSPSLAISEEYDDNILLSSTDRQSDFVTSVTPGLRLTMTESPWTVTAAASVRALYYVGRPDLNSSTDNRQGSLAIEFRPTPRLVASVTDTFVRSLEASEVDPVSGIIIGRFPSTSNTITPVVSYEIDPLTRIRLQYSFSLFRSDSALAEDSDTHEAGVLVNREFTSRTSGTLRYTFSRFRVEPTPARDSHLPMIGVAHALSPTIRVSAEAGPLFIERSDGSFETSVGASFQYAQEFSRGRFSVAYDRSSRVAGVIGEVTVSQGVTATGTLSVTRSVTVALDSGLRATESQGAAEDFLVYTAAVRVDYRVLQWLAFNAGYRYFRQDDRVGNVDLDRNVIFLGVTASPDFRVY